MKNKFLLLFYSSLIFSLFVAGFVSAAEISIVPDSKTVAEGGIIGASVYIDTSGKNINNIEALISFPPGLLSVESVSNSGSIFNLWVEQPNFNNGGGTISFNGGATNPGYNGARGLVARIVFKAKKAGSAAISFASASVLLNDGLGTDDTKGKNGAVITITAKPAVVEPPPAPNKPIPVVQKILEQINQAVNNTPEKDEETDVVDNLSEAPIITSDNVPDPDGWYAVDEAKLDWKVPQGIKSVQISYGKNPDGVPSVNYAPPISSKTLPSLRDGVWYFHARFKNSFGWSPITHRKIQIDNTPPTKLEVTTKTTDDDLINFSMYSWDLWAGIGKYSITIDDGAIYEIPTPNATSGNSIEYTLPPIKPGNHSFEVAVYDKAGNSLKKRIEYSAPQVKQPKILTYTKQVKKGESVEIQGQAYYPDTKVEIWMNNEKRGETISDKEGSFKYVSEPMDKDYQLLTAQTSQLAILSIFAKTVRAEGVESKTSEEIDVILAASPIQNGFMATDTATIIAVVVILLFVVMFSMLGWLYYDMYKFKSTKKILNRDLAQTDAEVKNILAVIQNEIKNSQKILRKVGTKRQQAMDTITQEEYKVLSQLSKNIEIAEKYFSEKLKNIEERE